MRTVHVERTERRVHHTFAGLALAALLSGCGGGDSGADAGAVAGPGTDATGPPTPASEAVAFQIDAAHSGVANAPTPSLPLPSAWQRTFAGTVSYPLIVGGKVFVIVGSANFNGPVQLVAIDQQTGLDAWPAISIGASYAAAHAYDQGRIVVTGSDSILRSFDAATGTPQWSTLLPFNQGSPPVARDGKVYVTAGNVVAAVDGRSGAILWTTPAPSQSSPSLSTSGVLATSSCQVYSLLQSTGAERWRATTQAPCNGGDTGAVVVSGGRAYARDFDFVASKPTLTARDAETGALLGSANLFGFNAVPVPAVTGDAAYVLNGGTLQRFDPTLQSVAWSFAGDGTLASAPLVIGQIVLVGSANGRLHALDTTTGAERWSTLVPAGIDRPYETFFTIVSGMAAANGLLVVPAGRTLNAWRLSPL